MDKFETIFFNKGIQVVVEFVVKYKPCIAKRGRHAFAKSIDPFRYLQDFCPSKDHSTRIARFSQLFDKIDFLGSQSRDDLIGLMHQESALGHFFAGEWLIYQTN